MTQKPERKFYLKQFKAISNAISTYEDFNLLVSHLAEGVCRTFKVKGCSLLILDQIEQQLFRVSSHGISDEYLEKGPIYVKDGLEEFKTGKPVIFRDFQNDPRVQYPEAAIKEGIAAMLSIPIRCKTVVLGLLKIYSADENLLHDEDLESVCILADHLGLVIEKNGLKNFVTEIKMAVKSLPLRLLKGF